MSSIGASAAAGGLRPVLLLCASLLFTVGVLAAAASAVAAWLAV